MPSVAELIRRDLGGLTPNERRAAQRLLADYPVAGLDTAARFGSAAGVSAPTVLRMIARLGFNSYGAFQDALRSEIAARRETPLAKGAAVRDGDWLQRFAEATIANIRQTEANVAREEFDAVVKRLADAGRFVHVAGGRFTVALAEYLVLHLRVLRPGVRLVTGEQQSRVDQILDIGKGDTLIVFDIRRYSNDIADLAGKAARRGAAVTLFTDQWLSPISKVARHVLPAHVAAPSVWDSSSGMLLLVEAILSATAHALGSDARHRLNQIETLREP
jgi:DNA-binding MurR/RpiR family transcriptional regulator